MRWQCIPLSFNYIVQVDTAGSCYEFYGERWYPVANGTIQHVVKIVDTSEPGTYVIILSRFTLNSQLAGL